MDEPDPAARPRRRSFSAEYKAEILDEYDALPVGSSERGAVLRREGLGGIGVAVKWQRASSGDWTNYAADVSRRDNDPTAAHTRLTPRDMAHDRLKLAPTPRSAPT